MQPFIISKSGKHSSLVDGADEKCFLDGGKKHLEEGRGPLSSFFVLKLCFRF